MPIPPVVPTEVLMFRLAVVLEAVAEGFFSLRFNALVLVVGFLIFEYEVKLPKLLEPALFSDFAILNDEEIIFALF